MYLALCLNQPSPLGMLEQMTAFEFNLWARYFQKSRFGPERAERQRAMIGAAMLSQKMRRGHSVAAEKLMPKDEWPVGERPDQSLQQQILKAREITKAYGGTDRTKYAEMEKVTLH